MVMLPGSRVRKRFLINSVMASVPDANQGFLYVLFRNVLEDIQFASALDANYGGQAKLRGAG